jgi:hypothetical protein
MRPNNRGGHQPSGMAKAIRRTASQRANCFACYSLTGEPWPRRRRVCGSLLRSLAYLSVLPVASLLRGAGPGEPGCSSRRLPPGRLLPFSSPAPVAEQVLTPFRSFSLYFSSTPFLLGTRIVILLQLDPGHCALLAGHWYKCGAFQVFSWNQMYSCVYVLVLVP